MQNHKNISDLFFIGSLSQKFDNTAAEKGLSYALKKALLYTGCNVEVKNLSEKTKEILTTHPVVVTTVHPVIPVIAALPERKNSYLVTASELMSIGNHTKDYLIPVFIEKHYQMADKPWMVKAVKMLNITPHVTPEEAHEKNKESIQQTSEKVNNGGLVTMVPEGIHGANGKWFSGIGYLLKQITNKDAYYIKAYPKVTPKIPFLNNEFLLQSFEVFFSEPMLITEIMQNNDAKQLTQILEHDYKTWEQLLV